MIDEWMNMVRWWHNTDRGKAKDSERSLSHCH